MHMLRNDVLLAGLLTVVASGCEVEAPKTPKPANLILISLDALRADHLSSYGYHRRTTPFLDEIAAQGIRYSHATVNTHGTPPSHTTMLSSLYQETHRVGLGLTPGQPEAPLIPGEIELLPEILSREGWATVGVTGGGWMSAGYGFSRGFDRFVSGGRTADEVVSMFVEELAAAATADRPFFAFFHTYQVHSPYLPPDGYGEVFGTFEGRIRPTSDALKPISSTAGAVLERTDFDYLISQYDGEIRFLDDQLRVLFERLHSAGLLENTVLLITSDHGEEFGDHGGVLHRGTLFDELVRVPFILWGRDIPAGVVDPALVSTIDIAPTLLGIAGVSPPAAIEGRNILDQAPTPWRDQRVFAQYGTAVYSIRTPSFKLIRYGNGRTMLFDLIADPRERKNLAAAEPDLTAVLDAELEAWRNARPRLGDDTGAVTEIDPSTEERLRALGYLD